MAWGVVVAAGLVASSSASTRGRTAFLWEAPASRGCGFAGSVEVVGVAALDLDASYEPEWVLAAYARRLNAHPTCGVAVGGANVSVDLTVVDVKSRDFGAVRDPAATVVVSGAADAYWNRTGVVVAADPAATRSMLNASDAFFSVLRPADDRGWARTLAALATAVPGRSAFWVYEPAANASANALAAAVAASDAWSGSGVMIAGARKPKDDYAADALDAAAAAAADVLLFLGGGGAACAPLAESLEARGDDFYDALVFAGCDGVTTGVPRRCSRAFDAAGLSVTDALGRSRTTRRPSRRTTPWS